MNVEIPGAAVERQRAPLPLQLVEGCKRASRWMRIVGVGWLIAGSLLTLVLLRVGVHMLLLGPFELTEVENAVGKLVGAVVIWASWIATGVLLVRAAGEFGAVAAHPERGHGALVEALVGLIPLFMVSAVTTVVTVLTGRVP